MVGPELLRERGDPSSVTIEPRVGGRVFATHEDLGEHDWGEVTVWEPGRRFAHTFTLAQDPQAPSEVSAEFADEEGGCTPARPRWLDGGERRRPCEVQRLAGAARPVREAGREPSVSRYPSAVNRLKPAWSSCTRTGAFPSNCAFPRICSSAASLALP